MKIKPLHHEDFQSIVLDILASEQLSRVQLAVLCECSESHIRNMEKTQITPSWPLGCRLIEIYNEYCAPED